MKKVSDYLIAGLCIISLAFSGGALYKAQAATNNIEQNGQPIDLTYAAKKALPAVVHIKYVQNSKTQTVDAQEDLASFFGIRSIPTLLFIPQEGKPSMQVGAMNRQQLEDAIKKTLLKQ